MLTDSTHEAPKAALAHKVGYDPKHSKCYGTSYVLIVLKIMNSVGLGPLQDVMNTEAKLMDVTAEIQSDLTTIQQYLTRIEDMSSSGGAWKQNAPDKHLPSGVGFTKGTKGWYSPNGFNGLAWNEFHEGQDAGTGVPSGQYQASDFQNATLAFVSALNNLFSVQNCSKGSPDASSNFTSFSVNKESDGKTVTQTIFLNDASCADNLFHDLNHNPMGWGMVGAFSPNHPAFAKSDTESASLMQKYTYYKYKLAAEQYDGVIPTDSKGYTDFTKLGVNVDPSSSSCDGLAKSMFSVLNSFNTSVDVDRDNDGGYNSAANIRTSSQNFLSMVFNDPWCFHDISHTNEKWNGRYQGNIYSAFSFAAFNYYWTKNPNADVTQETHSVPTKGAFSGDYNWAKDKGSTQNGDQLSIWYSDSQSASSLVSSTSSESSTTMQGYTSEVSQYQNIGQNIIKSSSEANIATIQNDKSG